MPEVTAKRIRWLLLPLAEPVSARTVPRYVAELRAVVTPKETFVHRRVQPGTTMEIDFGESWVDITGVSCRVKYLVVTLPFSNAYFAKAYAVEQLESLLDGVKRHSRLTSGGLRPLRWTASGRRFDRARGVLILELYGSEIPSAECSLRVL